MIIKVEIKLFSDCLPDCLLNREITDAKSTDDNVVNVYDDDDDDDDDDDNTDNDTFLLLGTKSGALSL